MKKFYLLASMVFLAMLTFAQPVSRNWVLVEIGTGCWCYYCPGAALGADDLDANGDPAAIIENHNGDPFATTDSDARNSYYGITGYPTAWFDGSYDNVVGGSHTSSMYSTYEPIVNTRITMDSDFTLDIFGDNDGDNYDITVRMQDVNSYSGTNLWLRFALTESDISYSWQGQSEVNFVNRLMVGGSQGTDLSGYTLTNLTDIPLSFTFNSTWVDANCELVAFIQDDDTKEVLQSQKVDLLSLVPMLEADFVASDTTSCTGSSIDFTDLSSGSGITSWSWTFEGGTPATSTDQNPSVVYNAPGIYDVQLTVSDANGSDTKLVTDYINILEVPAQADVPSGDASVCNGDPASYSIPEIPYAQNYEWELTPAAAGTLTVSNNEATLNPTEDWTGDFTLKVRATNICGDGAWSNDFNGTLLDSPNVFELNGDTEYCSGTDGSELTLSGSEVDVSYELYLDAVPTGVIVEGTGSPISFGYQTDEGFYTAVGSNTDCDMTMMSQIEVSMIFPPLEPATPTGEVAICNDQVNDYATEGSEDAYDYSWYIDPVDAGTVTANGTEATVDWNEDFAGEVSLSVAGINDCGEGNPSEVLVIDVDDIPEPAVSGAFEVCDNQDEVYETAETEGNEYTWEVSGGTLTEGQGTATITVHWEAPGNGTIYVSEETPNGCWGESETINVTIDNCTGLSENSLVSAFKVYPNPATDKIRVDITGNISFDGELVIRNQLGQAVLSKDISVGENNTVQLIDISTLTKGIYFISITKGSESSVHQRFVVE